MRIVPFVSRGKIGRNFWFLKKEYVLSFVQLQNAKGIGLAWITLRFSDIWGKVVSFYQLLRSGSSLLAIIVPPCCPVPVTILMSGTINHAKLCIANKNQTILVLTNLCQLNLISIKTMNPPNLARNFGMLTSLRLRNRTHTHPNPPHLILFLGWKLKRFEY